MASSQEKARRKSTNLLFLRITGPIFSVFLFILINFEVNLEPKTVKNVLNVLIIAFLFMTVFLQSVTTARLFNSIFGLSLLLFVGLKFTNIVANKYYNLSLLELIFYTVFGLILVSIGNMNKTSVRQ